MYKRQEVRLNTFHAVTEKARYTTGGRHNINFDYLLRDVTTGLPVAEVKNVDATFKAYGGSKAVAAENRGETQKVRITQRVSDIMYQQMIGNTEIWSPKTFPQDQTYGGQKIGHLFLWVSETY